MRRLPVILIALLAGPWARAAPSVWVADAGHGRLACYPSYEGQAFEAVFRHWTARLDWDAGTLEAEIRTGSLASGDPDRDRAMTAPEWLDAAGHPGARFRARVVPRAGGFLAAGQLTLKGVTRPVTLPFTWEVRGGQARLRGETVLDRGDFGIGADEAAVGPSVRVVVDARFRPVPGAGPPGESAP